MPLRPALLFALLAGAACYGCQELMTWNQADPVQQADDNAVAALQGRDGHSKLVGDYISVSGYTNVMLEGVGLVTNLDGTGEDPPASPYRTMLLEDMKKRRIKDPNSLLRDSSTALVLVRAHLPPLIKKGEKFDVEVVLPDGAQTKSLSGGWLLECDLREHAYIAGGGVREGDVLARAAGPILLGTGEGEESYELAAVRRGGISGGAVYVGRQNRDLKAVIRNDYRSAKMSERIARRIGERFHDYDDHGQQQPLAEATTDRKLTLKVHDRYRDNYPRYLQVLRRIALSEPPVERHLRLQQLKEQLHIPEQCEEAALQLEAVGVESLPMLEDALDAEDLECRFRAAEAMAYLGSAEGAAVLAAAAAEEPALRVWALAALATLDDGRAFELLAELLNHPSVELRYGAFRALTTANPNDPTVRGVPLPSGCSLHLLETTGPPLIHLTRRQKSEIVLFDAKQRFETPLVCRAGQRIIVKADTGSGIVRVSRIAAGEAPRVRETSTQVADVIQAAAELGASYPEIVQMLVQAEHQSNLPGRVAIDEMPRTGRVLRRRVEGSAEAVEAPIGSDALTPNLFQTGAKPPGGVDASELPPEPEADAPPESPMAPNLDVDAPDLDAQKE